MPHDAIFTPFLLMILLTFVVWVYMYARRIPFLQSLDVEPNALTPGELTRLSPPAVANPSDNLKNLFELPCVFYAVVLYLHVRGLVDVTHVVSAWVFVVFRFAHSAVHCTVNVVLLRFGLYAISAAALWFMVLRAVLQHVF